MSSSGKKHNDFNQIPPVSSITGEEEEDDSLDEDDMIEYFDDEDEMETTDQGDLGDVEDEVDDDEEEWNRGPGLDGFQGIKPDYVLTAHMGSAVFCTAFDSSGTKLITGGEDDVANVWDATSIKTRFPILKCKGHSDSIIHASFSWDSIYFCTADLSGIIKVWKTSTKELITTFETQDLSWSFWHTKSHVLFAGAEDGSIYMWKIPSGVCKLYKGSDSKCECGTLLPCGMRLVAGYSDGAVKMFDLKSGEILQQFSKGGTEDIPGVICIDHHPVHSLIATGNTNGSIKVYNTSNGKLLNIWHCTPGGIPSSETIDDEKLHSVESVVFWKGNGNWDFLAAGTVTGHFVVWDVNKMIERFRLDLDVGITKVIWNPIMPFVYCGGMDGTIRQFDARTCKQEEIFGRHHSEVLDLAITSDGSKLASGSDDGSAFIFELKKSEDEASSSFP